MANPCILTIRGVEYTYPEWIEYLAKGGLDKLIEEGLIKDMKPVSEVVSEARVGGKSFTLRNKEDVFNALKELGYSDEESRANAELMEMAATAASTRYGINKEDYYNITLRDYSGEKKESIEQKEKNVPRGRFLVESASGKMVDVIELLKAKNASTFPHELGHKHLQTIIDLARVNNMAKSDLEILAKEYIKQKKSNQSVNEVVEQMMATDKMLIDNTTYRDVHEFFTNGFERWLKEGDKAGFSEEMVRVFEQFKKFLEEVYRTITNTRLAEVELSPEMNKFYNDIFGGDWEQIKKNQKEAKADVVNKDMVEALKSKDAEVGGLSGWLGEQGKGLSQQPATMLQKIFEEAIALRNNGDVDQYNVVDYLTNYLNGLRGKENIKDSMIDEAISLVNANKDKLVELAGIKGRLRAGFINAINSKEVSDEEKRLLRKSDVATYVRVSLEKLGKTAEEVIKDLTFDEAIEAVNKVFKLDFANDESLSQSVATLAAVITKGRNEMKGAPESMKKDYIDKLNQLYEKYEVVGTIMGKGVSALRLMVAVDPDWFVANMKKKMDEEVPTSKKSAFEKKLKELKQQVEELDNHNSDLLFELADKEKMISNLTKEIEKAKKAKQEAEKEKPRKVSIKSKWTKEQMAGKEALLKQKMDILKARLKDRGLNQDSLDEMSESELIQSIAKDISEIELQKGRGLPISKFTAFIKSNFGDVDYDIGVLYRSVVDELSSDYGREAFSSDQAIEDFLGGAQEEINAKVMKIAEAEAERELKRKKKDELKTLRRLMKANKEIADKKIKALADFAKNKIVESGLWGRYLDSQSSRLATEITNNIAIAMGYKSESKEKAMLDEFSQALSANISALINERFPVDKESAKKIDYAQRLRDISANKEKFEQMFQEAMNKVEKKFKDSPEVKNILAQLSKDKNVFSSKMMRSAIFDKLNSLETKIGDFILKESAEKESMTEEILSDIAIDDAGLRSAIRNELDNIEAELFGGATMNVAERIMKDITNETKGYTAKETTLIQKVKNALISQYRESVKDKRVKQQRTESELLSDALSEAMHLEGGKMFAGVKEVVGKFIDGSNWTPEEKQRARDFISDYQKSVFQSLVTAKVGNEIISNAVINAGYVREQKVGDTTKVFPNWKQLVTDIKQNKEGVRQQLIKSLESKIGDAKFADAVINHIVDMYDMRVEKESERFVANEINKIAAKNDVTRTKGKITSKLKALINLSNTLGGLNNPLFKEKFADEFGLTAITDDEAKHITRMLEKVAETPEGNLRNERAEIAAGVIDYYKSKANFTVKMMLSNLYSTVLAHPITTAINAYAIPKTYMVAMTKSMFDPAYRKIFFRAMNSGVFAAGVKEGMINAPDDYTRHTNIKFRPEEVLHEVMPNNLEVWNKLKKGQLGTAMRNTFLNWSARGIQAPFTSKSKNAVTWTKFMSRVQNSTDALVQMGMGNMKAYEYFVNQAIKDGKTKEEARVIAWKQLFPIEYTEAMKNAEEEFANRGITPTLLQVKVRANEIIKQYRSKDVNNMIERIGFTAAMRDKPQTILTGSAGVFESAAWAIETMTEGALRKLEKEKKGQLFFSLGKYQAVPFVRTIGHLLDRGIDATGLGIARGGLRYVKNVRMFDRYSSLRHDVKKGDLTKEEAQFIEMYKVQRSLTDAFTGVALLGVTQALISLFGDDDDGFYGNNEEGGSVARQKGLKNVLRFQGVNIPMGFLGVVAPVGYVIGNIQDNIRNHKKKRIPIWNPVKLIQEYEDSYFKIPVDAIKSVAQMSFLPTTSTVFRDDMKSVSKVGMILGTNLVGAVGIPHRMINDLYQLADRKTKESYSFADGVLKAMPYLEMLPYVDKRKNAFDYLGREIRIGGRPAMKLSNMIDSFNSEIKSNEVDRFFVDNKLNTPEINRSASNWSRVVEKNGITGVELPNYNEMYDIYRTTAQNFNYYITKENGGEDGDGLERMRSNIEMDAIKESRGYENREEKEAEYINKELQKYVNDLWHKSEKEAYDEYNKMYDTNFKKKGEAIKEAEESYKQGF